MAGTLTIRVLAVAVSIALLAGCAAVLVPGAETDEALGKETAAAVERDIGLVDSPALLGYVRSVGRRVAAQRPQRFEYRFFVVDQPEPNAFAAPGGYVYVSRGLLAVLESEDELAGVLAHEIVHVERRHSVRQMTRERRIGLLSLPGELVASVISDDLAKLVGAPRELAVASFSRDQERESDDLGQELAARAGYDARALGAALDRMERLASLMTSTRRAASYFDTHPPTPERTRDIERRAAGLAPGPAQPVAATATEFVGKLDGLLWGEDPAHGVVSGSRFQHPGLDFGMTFPAGWEVVNTPRFVAARSPAGDGLVMLGALGEGGAADLPRLRAALADRMLKQHRVRPSRAEEVTIGGNPGSVLVFTDRSGREPVHLYFLWIALRGQVYHLVGLSPESHRPILRASVESLQPLTAAERSALTEVHVRTVTARAGESIQAVSARTGNVWSAPLTAALNGLDPAQPIPGDRLVKIAVRVPYRGLR